jgi:hypothetical protein
MRSKLVMAAVTAAAGLLLIAGQLPAGAQTTDDPITPVTGNATYFDALGSPYGGCGVPQAILDSPHFVALPRPLTGADADKAGIWNNGLNCGRFLQVSIGDFCTGVNDGSQGQAFCRTGSWTSDQYNDATLTMIVADSCGDTNAWCRDDPYHLDLAKASINQFVKDGAPVGDLLPNHWNNRHVSWKFVPAPDYTGDIRIGFVKGAQAYWPAVVISHLANGIHGVDYLSGGTWVPAKMNADMGQSYLLGNLPAGETQFQIRVRDAADQLINSGRVYTFGLPAACGTACSEPYTETAYTTTEATSTVAD